MGYLYSFIKIENMEKLTKLPKVMKQVREKKDWEETSFPLPERSNWIPTEDVSSLKTPIMLNLLHYFSFLLFLICWMVLINLVKRQTVSLEMSYITSASTISKNKGRFFRMQIIKLSTVLINKPCSFHQHERSWWPREIRFPLKQYPSMSSSYVRGQ